MSLPAVALLLSLSLIQSQKFLTKPELTNYRETSTYADVISFLKSADEASEALSLTNIGVSTEGREIPLAVVSWPPVRNPRDAREKGKLVIYIQGNIHAGEVEGKESALKLIRNLVITSTPQSSAILKNAVLLINPIYNADGNEKWGPVAKNRPEQDGPEQVGLRPNGQGFDLNRDCIKAESPEMRSALQHIYEKWDPDAVLDLHTTDGTRHGYDLTFSPPLNPNTPAEIRKYAQDELLVDVRKQLKWQFGLETFDYGNAARVSGNLRWETFGQEGRYVTNYAGLGGRVGILSEATTFISFKDRIEATDRFMRVVLDRLAKDSSRIQAMRARIQVPNEMGVRFEMAEGRTEKVLLEDLAEGQRAPFGRPEKLKEVLMPVLDRFKSTRTAKVPDAYFIPLDQPAAARLAQRHGFVLGSSKSLPPVASLEKFEITDVVQDQRAFQGHRLMRLEGKFTQESTPVGQGWIVRVEPKTAALAFTLFEPESLDGLAAWEVLGEKLEGNYPILKVFFK